MLGVSRPQYEEIKIKIWVTKVLLTGWCRYSPFALSALVLWHVPVQHRPSIQSDSRRYMKLDPDRAISRAARTGLSCLYVQRRRTLKTMNI
jgi:succinate dehydrogenase/fumarate reductase flavoprotein subunit